MLVMRNKDEFVNFAIESDRVKESLKICINAGRHDIGICILDETLKFLTIIG
jgi:hypothetical protein